MKVCYGVEFIAVLTFIFSRSSSSAELKTQVVELRRQLHQERQHNSRLKLQLVSAEEDAQLHARDVSAPAFVDNQIKNLSALLWKGSGSVIKCDFSCI